MPHIVKKIPSAKPARRLRISRFACHASRVTSVISLINLKEKYEIDHIERAYVLLDDKSMLHV